MGPRDGVEESSDTNEIKPCKTDPLRGWWEQPRGVMSHGGWWGCELDKLSLGKNGHETQFSALLPASGSAPASPHDRSRLCAVASPVHDLNERGEGWLRHGQASHPLPLLQGLVSAKGWDRQLQP